MMISLVMRKIGEGICNDLTLGGGKVIFDCGVCLGQHCIWNTQGHDAVPKWPCTRERQSFTRRNSIRFHCIV